MDHRADLYALGCVGFELLSGTPPFPNRTAHQMLAAQVSMMPEPLQRRRPGVPPALASLVMQLLEKRPADRPQSAADVQRTLETVHLAALAAPVSEAAAASGSVTRSEGRTVIVGRRRSVRRAALAAAGVAALAAALSVSYRLLRQPTRRTASTQSAATSIAVLPFANLSADPKTEYFSDGMTEELNTALSKVEGLQVAASASAFALKHARLSATTIGDTLHVAALLQGSVRQDGNRVRINAQLVDARDGYEMWSEKYDRDLKDVFAVQDEIARAIVAALRLRLRLTARTESTLVRSATVNVDAHDDYLKGRFLWNQRTYQSLRDAASFFERAIARDSEYAEAYAGLADTYVVLPAFGPAPPQDAFSRAKLAAQHALALDSTVAEAHNSLAYARLVGDYDWSGAEYEFRRALELNPSYANAHAWYSDELLWLGRSNEALAEKERACSLDPLSRIICVEFARNLFYVGRYDDALRRLQSAVAVDPTFARTYVVLCRVYLAKRQLREAVAACDQGATLSGRESWATALLGHAYGEAGDRGRAQAILRELEARRRREYVSPLGIAVARLGTGDTVGALAWLDSAVAGHDPRTIESIGEPIWAPFRSHPHLIRLRQRLGLGP